MSMPPEMMQAQLAQSGQDPTQGGQAPGQAPGQPAGRGRQRGEPSPPPDAQIDEQALVQQMQETMRVASNILYEEAVFNALSQMASTAGVVEALSVTTVKILTRVQDELGDLPMEVLFGAGMAIIADAADALQQGGIEVGEKEVTSALQMAITRYLQENPEQFSEEDIKQGMAGLKQGIDQLNMSEMEGSASDGGAPAGGLLGEM